MAEWATISVKKDNGSVSLVSCQSDGSPGKAGLLLFLHYNSQEDAESVVEFGDLGLLDKSMEKPEGHTLRNPVAGYSIAMKRDIRTHTRYSMYDTVVGNNLKTVLTVKKWDHNYYWDGKRWWYLTRDEGAKNKITLKKAIEAAGINLDLYMFEQKFTTCQLIERVVIECPVDQENLAKAYCEINDLQIIENREGQKVAGGGAIASSTRIIADRIVEKE